ncbi:hypothetical protein QZH41_006286, partial [Actinostola sp. cb2023]
MKLLFIFIIFLKNSRKVKGDGGCKAFEYLACIEDHVFNGHVVNTFRVVVPGLEACQRKCYLNERCVSYNLGPVEGQIRTCELNDFDHVTFPDDVIPRKGFEYCPIK